MSGTEIDKVEPPPPIATGFEPPDEPMTKAGMSTKLLRSRDKPPPAPPKEIDTPASGVICKPEPGVAWAAKSTAPPPDGMASLTD